MATKPLSDLTATWNAGGTTFTAVKMNVTDTASASGSALLDLQVGGVSQFKVSKAGAVTAVGVAVPTISSTDTLSNKTLSSPTLSGTVSAAGGVTVSQGTFNYFQVTDVAATSGQTGYRINVKDSGGVNRDTYLYGVGASANLLLPASGTFYISAASGSAGLQLNSVAIPTISSTDTLSNKTLSSPAFSGTASGTFTSSGEIISQSALRYNDGTLHNALGTDGSVGLVGTLSNHALVFWTNGAERMRLSTAGALTLGGAAIPTISSTDTLTNKTLSGVTIADATDIALATGTGTKIGTATTQKLGFFNATPVVQPTAVADATDAASVITQLNALLTRMRNLGLIAT